MSWVKALHERFESNRLAAEALLSLCKKRARKAAKGLEVRALANRISRLAREGDRTGWWKKRPQLQELLASLLEMEPDEIFRPPIKVNEGQPIAFPEFPKLPPLRSSEAVWGTYSRRDSLYGVVQRLLSELGGKRYWVKAPMGSGKSLLVKRMATESHCQALSIRSLSDARQAIQSEDWSLLIEVEEPSPDDVSVLADLSTRGFSTVVMAPFALPNQASGWTEEMFHAEGHWRERFLDWVAQRLGDANTGLRETVLGWLSKRSSGTSTSGLMKAPLGRPSERSSAPCGAHSRAPSTGVCFDGSPPELSQSSKPPMFPGHVI
ncbi:MAG: hypothetical protein ACLPJH_12505 [Myxococcaceae bacterium]